MSQDQDPYIISILREVPPRATESFTPELRERFLERTRVHFFGVFGLVSVFLNPPIRIDIEDYRQAVSLWVALVLRLDASRAASPCDYSP